MVFACGADRRGSAHARRRAGECDPAQGSAGAITTIASWFAATTSWAPRRVSAFYYSPRSARGRFPCRCFALWFGHSMRPTRGHPASRADSHRDRRIEHRGPVHPAGHGQGRALHDRGADRRREQCVPELALRDALQHGPSGIILGTICAVVGRCAIWMPWYVMRVLRQTGADATS